jgi:hypothetical protein
MFHRYLFTNFLFITPHDVRKLIDHRTSPTLCLQTQASQI